eukprot:TRINITY_DN19131_c0_g1_i1.p2 TRINITY_DN19131_c0_g1~~TRINITY_DN19131_c0_g1_i1.p2  ORF type:complete len:137 (+),score=3.24 TRINITY_DN19131_c0_g1_i1:220-630(+)
MSTRQRSFSSKKHCLVLVSGRQLSSTSPAWSPSIARNSLMPIVFEEVKCISSIVRASNKGPDAGFNKSGGRVSSGVTGCHASILGIASGTCIPFVHTTTLLASAIGVTGCGVRVSAFWWALTDDMAKFLIVITFSL